MQLSAFRRAIAKPMATAGAMLLLCTLPATVSAQQSGAQASNEPKAAPRSPRAKKTPNIIVLPSPPLATKEVAKQAPAKRRPRKSKVPDKLDLLEALLRKVGQELVEIADGEPEGIFLYVEIGRDWVSPHVFQDDGKTVRALDSSSPLLKDLLRKIWIIEPDDKRWSVLEYVIENGQFEASYKYPDEIDVETLGRDHRRDALRARYGRRKILYPPPPKDAGEPTI